MRKRKTRILVAEGIALDWCRVVDRNVPISRVSKAVVLSGPLYRMLEASSLAVERQRSSKQYRRCQNFPTHPQVRIAWLDRSCSD